MAQVTVKINGYNYTVGCEDGQEQHLLGMAAEVESRVESIRQLGSQTGEARLLVLAALLMADELHDMKADLEAARAAAATSGGRKKGDGESARRLSRLAQRAEQIAANLDQS